MLRPVQLVGGEQTLFAVTTEGKVYATGNFMNPLASQKMNLICYVLGENFYSISITPVKGITLSFYYLV